MTPRQLTFDDLLGMYTEDIPRDPGHYVYRLWSEGSCLYVGMTGIWAPRRLTERWRDHRYIRGRPWLSKITRRDVASFKSGDDALAEEKLQIANLEPLYNKVGRKGVKRGVFLG